MGAEPLTVPDTPLPGPGQVVRWALAWGVLGTVVAVAIAFSNETLELLPALVESLVLAEVLGLSVLVSTRLIFPRLTGFSYLTRTALQIAVLFAGALTGSIGAFAFRPLFALANWRMVLTIILVNALLAVIVGIAVHTFDRMRMQIEASYRLLREKEALERELEIAREVQRGLLPQSLPGVDGLELCGVVIPAIAVGGDYYDFLPMEDGDLGFVIADVSGKGIPAALLVASLHAAVRSTLSGRADVGEVAARLNRLLFDSSSESRYATVVLGCWDASTRTVRYSNGGHHPPLLVDGAGVRELPERGLPIGLFDETRYTVGRQRLRPGDLLALFTDGVLEMPAPDGSEFGVDRLGTLLREHREQPLDGIRRRVLDALSEWSEGQTGHDDVTLVLMRAT